MNLSLNHAVLGPVAAFLSAVTWAIGSTNYSKMTRHYRAFDVNFTRAIFALPFFILAGVMTTGGFGDALAAFRGVDRAHFTWLTVSILSSYALGDIFFFMSTASLGVPGALAIASGFPILTALAGAVFDHEMPTLTQWCGLVLAISGMILVILNDPKAPPKLTDESVTEKARHPWLKKRGVGVVLAGFTAVAWGMNSYAVAKGGEGVNPAIANSIRMFMALFLIATVSGLATRTSVRPMKSVDIRRYGWLFIIEGFMGSYLFVYGLSHSSIMLGSTLASLSPVLAVPIAVSMKLERFSWVRTTAVATVVVGLSLLFR